MTTVLVFGRHGRLASALEAARPDFTYVSQTDCDLTVPEQVHTVMRRLRPKVVINCAAQTDMDACERDPASCRKINTDAVKTLAAACNEQASYLIHISTDFAVDPVNEYGKSKRDAESYAATAGVAIRVNFYTSESFVLKNIRAGKPINAYTDVFFNPLSILSFTAFLTHTVDTVLKTHTRPYSGLISVGVKEKLAVYDFALLVCSVFGKNPDLVTRVTWDGSGLPRNRDTYINPVNNLSARKDLEHYHDSLTE